MLKRKIAPHVADIVAALQQAGYETYVVGGAVRDFLMDREPKDYDLSTAATPEQVRSVFGRRRSFIIGRRFKLVHLYHGSHIIEISTFRRQPQLVQERSHKHAAAPANMILHDNEFGSSDEDAWRRDFTINAIFYDPVKNELKDFTGMGLDDLRAGLIRIIGDPGLRFEEDPVRLLRALKLVGQYGFTLEAETEKALVDNIDLLSHASPSRLSLELEKILKNPYGDNIITAFHKYRLLPHFLPVIDREWDSPAGVYMRELLAERNRRVREGAYRDSVSVAMGAMVLPFIEKAYGHHAQPGDTWESFEGIEDAVWELIRKVFHPRQLTKRLTASTLRMLLLQPRFHAGRRMNRVIEHPGYPHARELMVLQNQVKWNKPELLELWPARSRSHEQEQRRDRWRGGRSSRRDNRQSPRQQNFSPSPDAGFNSDEDSQD